MSEQEQSRDKKKWWWARLPLFSASALKRLKRITGWKHAFAALLACALLLSIPTDLASASLEAFLKSFLASFAGLTALIFAAIAASRLAGSRETARGFFPAAAAATALSLFAVSLPAAVAGFVVFKRLLNDASAAALFFSLIPFYNFVFFGWACEELSGNTKWRGAVVGLVSASLMLAFYLGLSALTS
ncbi:MAG: hypothetical protein ACP5O3_02530 [Candidatus Micrarchaeia archaeon]